MKRGGPNHPKTYALAESLGITRAHAVGLLEMLFHFTAQYAPRGDIGRYSNKRIAAGLDWHGNSEKLIQGLATAGWLDLDTAGKVVVHDWADHADRTTLQRLSRSGSKPLTTDSEGGDRRVTRGSPGGHLPVTGGSPASDLAVTPLETKTRPNGIIDIHGKCEQKSALPEPEPEPEPTPTPVPHTEWPLTTAELIRHDPAVDQPFVTRLVHTTLQALISAGDMEPFDDEDMADAIKESYSGFNGKKKHGNGLLLTRVPQIMLNWGKANGPKEKT